MFGTRVNVVSHVTDVWRVDFMIKYGGIYVDTDAAFVQKLDHEIRGRWGYVMALYFNFKTKMKHSAKRSPSLRRRSYFDAYTI